MKKDVSAFYTNEVTKILFYNKILDKINENIKRGFTQGLCWVLHELYYKDSEPDRSCIISSDPEGEKFDNNDYLYFLGDVIPELIDKITIKTYKCSDGIGYPAYWFKTNGERKQAMKEIIAELSEVNDQELSSHETNENLEQS